ncbi:hypothetical protein [Streptomyces sp. AA1529]|uniref:hypothetical protein n=1 Tax=Streptomyces sp. AA1529 TaxID=1203257 RepID=UPI003D759083
MAGEDRSTALLGRVEEILVAHFPDSPAFEEPAEPLSLFRPGAGPPCYSVRDMCAALQSAVYGPNPMEGIKAWSGADIEFRRGSLPVNP